MARKRRKQQIGLQNRLEIVVQSLLDYAEEGGQVEFGMAEEGLVIEVTQVVEQEGRFIVQAEQPTPANDDVTTKTGDT